MAIDWKTIISGFDGKPTLLQAIGKLRKAVEDETITIQQAQAEIAKLESQQKADEALITTAQSTADEAKINAYNASQKGDQALGKATTADTKAQQALENLNNKQDKITQTTNLSCRKIKTDSLSFTMELGSDSSEYDYGLLFASKNVVSTGQLKPSFVDENFFEWLLPAKSGTLATTNDIPAPAKLYIQKLAWENIDHSTNLFITPVVKVLTKTSTPLSITTAEEFSDKLKNLPVVGLGGTYYDSQEGITYLPDYFTTETNNLFYLGGIGFNGGAKILNASKLMDTTQYTLSITVEEF